MSKLKKPGLKKRFNVQTSCVAWIDLLGYGSQISAANFYPLHPKAKEANSRLRKFHAIVAKHSRRNFPSMAMNDGAIFYTDLSYNNNTRTCDFIKRSWELFQEVKKEEASLGFIGPRMFIASGFRMRGRRSGLDQTTGHLKSIFKRLGEKKINVEQAIHEAARAQAKFDLVPQLQSNYAFTKAYVADSAGASGGFGGSKIFLDTYLINQMITPRTIKLGKPIHWTEQTLNLKTEFSEILSINPDLFSDGEVDFFCDGLEVANKLSGDPKFIDTLYKNRKLNAPKK